MVFGAALAPQTEQHLQAKPEQRGNHESADG
jgi:hypothetical protein